VRGWSANPFKIQFSRFHWTCPVKPPDSKTVLPNSRDRYQTCPVSPPDLSGPWPAPREPHRTCPVDRTCSICDRLPEASHRTCPVPTRLVQLIRLVRPKPTSRELCRTCPVKALPNSSFELATQKRKAFLEIQNLSSSSSLPKIQALILILER
jgi:hypothetical protein